MIKTKLISFIGVGLGFLSINTYAVKVVSQPTHGCYFQDENGEIIDLSGLCGGTTVIPSNTSNPNSSQKEKTGNFEVKIKRRENGTPVVDVVLNQKKTYEMLLDTGASSTVLTVNMVTELGLKPKGSVLVTTPSSSTTSLSTTTLDSLEVGSGRLQNIEVFVSPNLPVGLLGQDFLEHYDLTIKQNVIEFKPRE
jgi:aspartyl protease family protein